MKAKPTQSSEVDPRTVAAGNDFGFRLMAALAGETLRENLFISPFSISVALAMTAAGARGETLTAMQETLGLAGLDKSEVERTFAAFMADPDRLSPGVQLAIANSLWVSLHEQLREEYVERVRAVFRAEAANLDFGQAAEAADTINAWVAERTADKIKDLLTPDAVANAALVLINAIYFKGTWEAQFDPKETKDGPFKLLSGDEKTLPMMRRSGEYGYYENKTLQAIRLPFGGEQTSMIVVLPREDANLDTFRQGFGAAELNRVMGSFESGEGEIVLPRFKVSCKAALNEPLAAIGMGVAFGGDADFSGVAKRGLFISAVIHQAVMEVNEEGVEAAAATAVVMARSLPILIPFEMIVNRPFFCALLDEDTGAILFVGWIAEPE